MPKWANSEKFLWCWGNFWNRDILFLYNVTFCVWIIGQNITILTSNSITMIINQNCVFILYIPPKMVDFECVWLQKHSFFWTNIKESIFSNINLHEICQSYTVTHLQMASSMYLTYSIFIPPPPPNYLNLFTCIYMIVKNSMFELHIQTVVRSGGPIFRLESESKTGSDLFWIYT